MSWPTFVHALHNMESADRCTGADVQLHRGCGCCSVSVLDVSHSSRDCRPFATEDGALREFKSKFRSKAGAAWENRASIEPKVPTAACALSPSAACAIVLQIVQYRPA